MSQQSVRIDWSPDPDFQNEEKLYIRVRPGDYDFSQNGLKDGFFKFPEQSVNREKYSKPEDVLNSPDPRKDCSTYGIIFICYGEIPPPTKDWVPNSFQAVHLPVEEENNYAHAGIQTLTHGIYRGIEPTKKIRQLMRQALKRNCRIFRVPDRIDT